MSPKLNWLRLTIYSLSASLIGLSFIGGVIGYSPIPYWDMWGATLQFVQRFDDDPFRLLFSQHNEHRIVLSRLLFLVDYHVFDGASAFLVVCNYLFALAIWAVLARCLLALNAAEKHPDRWILVALLGAWLFLWAQKVNFTWAFQSQFFLAQLLPLLAFLSLGQAAVRSGTWNRWFLSAVLLGAMSSLTMANGVFALPLMAFGAVLLRMKPGPIIVLALCAAIVISLYFSDYHQPSAHGSVLQTLTSQPLSILLYTFTYLGNPGVYIAGSSDLVKGLSALVGLGLAVTASGLTALAVRRCPAHPVSFGLLLFIIFVGAGAFVTATGRLSFGLDSAFSSRYTTPVLMAWAALFCIASPRLMRFHTLGASRPYITFSAAITALCLLMVGQVRALTPMHQINHQKHVAALALEIGIGDDTLVSLVHPNTDHSLAIARAASHADLGIFGTLELQSARELLGQSAMLSTHRTCAGDLENFEIIDNEPGYVRIYGWQFASRRERQGPRFHIVDADSKIVGIAIPGRASPHLEEAYGQIAARSGFTGYLQSGAVGKELRIISGQCQSIDRLGD
ncbi:MAG: hypothetical protein AAF996_14535 [Pseudomonadota bacterium]